MRIQAAVPDRFAYRPRREDAPEAQAGTPGEPAADTVGQAKPPGEPTAPAESTPPGAPRGPDDLNDKEKAQVLRLQQRDAEVRAHEAAHAAAAGMLGGGASYDYVTGPDGRQYAIGGEVPVRISSGSTPEEAIRNAQQVRAAALAQSEPSGQDRAVASQAAAMEAAARAELAELAAARFRAVSETAPSEPAPTPPSRSEQEGSGQGRAVQDSQPASRTELVRPSDPEETARQLEAEQRATRGSWRHMHLASGCGSCSAAAARYV